MKPDLHYRFANYSRGLSIVELLVAMTLSLLLIAGVITMFTSTRTTYEMNDRVARLQETGRFALESIARDLQAAGYRGCGGDLTHAGANFVNTVNPVPGNPVTGNGALNPPAVEGFEYTSANIWSPVLDTGWVISPAGTVDSDVILVRRPRPDIQAIPLTASMDAPEAPLATAPVAAGAPQLIQVGQILSVANCMNRAIFAVTGYDPTTGIIEHAAVAPNAASLGNSTASLGDMYGSYADADDPDPTKKRNANGKGEARIMLEQLVYYYLRDSSSGNGTSLWRRIDANAPEEIAEGIEGLQLLYGVGPDYQVTQTVTADAIPAGFNIISVSIALLTRSAQEYASITADTNTYDLLGKQYTAPGDHRLRQVFATTVAIRNGSQ